MITYIKWKIKRRATNLSNRKTLNLKSRLRLRLSLSQQLARDGREIGLHLDRCRGTVKNLSQRRGLAGMRRNVNESVMLWSFN
jgi:hypothetical protein